MAMLTDEDRKKFEEWLSENVASNEALMGQMDKADNPGMHLVKRNYMAETLAMKVVLKILSKIHRS